MTKQTRLRVIHPGSSDVIAVTAAQDDSLADVLGRAGWRLNMRCGGKGLCQGCRIELLEGAVWDRDERAEVIARGDPVRLAACRCELGETPDVALRIPARSLLAHEPHVVTTFLCNVSHALMPLWRHIPLDVHGDAADVRSWSAVAAKVSLVVGSELPLEPRGEFPISAQARGVVLEHRGTAWGVRPVDPMAADVAPWGIAIDLGTTTVVALLVDLTTGDVVRSASALNAQTHLGDNVLTRIQACLDDDTNTQRLKRAAVVGTILPLIKELVGDQAEEWGRVVCVTVAGNTTMLHLLAGVNPASMGSAPFSPVFLEHRIARWPQILGDATDEPDVGPNDQRTRARDLGHAFQTEPSVHLLPGAAAYVGADIMAGVFSSGMVYRDDPALLVDIGTNGEMVIKANGQLVACATAAGPAFEGAGLSCGMRAARGAIAHISLTGDPVEIKWEILGGGSPVGICGTAYLDFVAEARRAGWIDHLGRITPEGAASGHVVALPQGRGFLIAQSAEDRPLVISEGDIASFMQAKAAIATGVSCLLRRVGLEASQVPTLFLAGGFGFHMNVDHLIRCGLLPGFRSEQVQTIGNSSLAGAYLALLDAGALEEIRQVAGQVVVIELNLEPDFTDQYVDHLFLP